MKFVALMIDDAIKCVWMVNWPASHNQWYRRNEGVENMCSWDGVSAINMPEIICKCEPRPKVLSLSHIDQGILLGPRLCFSFHPPLRSSKSIYRCWWTVCHIATSKSILLTVDNRDARNSKILNGSYSVTMCQISWQDKLYNLPGICHPFC